MKSAVANKYLARINCPPPAPPTIETLRRIHRAHLLHVPFENLDISLKRPIILDETSFLRKIVELRRGGFCYELNGAFAELLRALGYQVTLLSARVAREDGSLGPEFDHLTLRIDLHEPWLADVGFGDCFLDPLRLADGFEDQQGGFTYRLFVDGDEWWLERKTPDTGWKLQYRFTLTPHQLEDFARMCHFHQTSPESHFTRQRICSGATPTGRITLSDQKLIITESGVRREEPVASAQEWDHLLHKHFGLQF